MKKIIVVLLCLVLVTGLASALVWKQVPLQKNGMNTRTWSWRNLFDFGGGITGATVIGTCEYITGVNEVVPADACCVLNGAYQGKCGEHGYIGCVANWMQNNNNADLAVMDAAVNSGVQNTPITC